MYLTLPSSACRDIFPDNSPSNYKIQLKSPLHLKEDTEVALVDISYLNTINNVDDFTIYTEFGDYPTFYHMRAGYYNNVEHLIKRIRLENNLVLRYDKALDRVKFKKQTNQTYFSIIDINAQSILGFNKHNYEKNEWIIAGGPPVLRRIIDTFYVYCNLMKETVVGDKEAKLLRTVPVLGEYNQVINQEFQNLYYHPIEKTEINTIEIDIRDDTGTKIDFNDYEVMLTLHLRWTST